MAVLDAYCKYGNTPSITDDQHFLLLVELLLLGLQECLARCLVSGDAVRACFRNAVKVNGVGHSHPL